MKSFRKQLGMTAIGWILVILLVVFAALFLVKLAPIYIGGFEVHSVVGALESEPGLGKKSARQIRAIILKRLDINMMKEVHKDDIHIERGKNTWEVEVAYEIREAVIGNLDVVISFNATASIPNY